MNIKTNVTACMSINQAYLASKAGTTYVSLFYNRIKDYYYTNTKNYILSKRKAENVIQQTQKLINSDPQIHTKLIVGSIRSPEDITTLLTLDIPPDIITIPTKILKEMCYHQKTVSTLDEFDKAWKDLLEAEKK